jgi:hypothetical protein
VLSYLAYFFWHPSAHVNYGELLEPHPLPDSGLVRLDGSRFAMSDLKGQWVLLTVANAECDERCRRDLVYLRQVRLATGKDAERIERVWLVSDRGTPAPALTSEHPGLIVVRAADTPVLRALPAASAGSEPVYIVDPLGNLMMRFPPDPDPRSMLKDVSRLLRHSKWK